MLAFRHKYCQYLALTVADLHRIKRMKKKSVVFLLGWVGSFRSAMTTRCCLIKMCSKRKKNKIKQNKKQWRKLKTRYIKDESIKYRLIDRLMFRNSLHDYFNQLKVLILFWLYYYNKHTTVFVLCIVDIFLIYFLKIPVVCGEKGCNK